MRIDRLLPDAKGLRCEQVSIGAELITLRVSSTAPTGCCPCCGQPSTRVHSRYVRSLTDLPWHGTQVRMLWEARRFRCSTPACARQIFCERLPQVAAVYSRRTTALTDAITSIAFACGGEPGSRLVNRLGMTGSPDSLLRLIRRSMLPGDVTPRVLGVDDWALRKGQRYGTILCDLENHRPIDLLPERSSQSLTTWLQAHPGVEVISRDRGEEYIKGATAGAPDAVQVADRFHLIHNLHEALVRVADGQRQKIEQAVRDATTKLQDQAVMPTSAAVDERPIEPVKLTKAEERKQATRTRRLQRYEQVVALHRAGKSLRAVARELGMNRGTVRRYISGGGFPERATPPQRRRIKKYEAELRRRWDEGCHNAVQLTDELQSHGTKVSYHMVRRCVAGWREPGEADSTPGKKPAPGPAVIKRPSSTRAAWLLMKQPSELEGEEALLRDAMLGCCHVLRSAAAWSDQFTHIVRERRAADLDAWIDGTQSEAAPGPIASFARGLTADLAAVRAALTQPWSNGQVEGQVNRLKLIKRQMYGRANFDLLRARFLRAI